MEAAQIDQREIGQPTDRDLSSVDSNRLRVVLVTIGKNAMIASITILAVMPKPSQMLSSGTTARSELAPHRIRVIAIAPRATRTPINTAAWSTLAAYGELMTLVPYWPNRRAADIAQAAVWLTSDAADCAFLEQGLMFDRHLERVARRTTRPTVSPWPRIEDTTTQ